MEKIKTKSVFGPIPSRRLGLSLGVDLLPFKTCSMDCIYCECGATTHLCSERKEYFPTDSVLAEIDEVMKAGQKIDYLTFSGVGEPTLHSGLGRIITHVKSRYPTVRICLLTNSSLLGDPALQEELRELDLIVPSLDGSNEEEFKIINRPAPGVTLQSCFEAILSFRAKNRVPMWLELFLVPGVNDSAASIERFKAMIRQIAPERIQLNSLDRPGVEDWIEIPTREDLEQIAERMKDAGNVEIISRTKLSASVLKSPERIISIFEYNENILKTLRSRPCTAEDIAVTLRYNPDKVRQHLRRMEKAGLLSSEEGTRGLFYRPLKKD